MEFLELLALKMDCEYISDLRLIISPSAALRRTVAEMPFDHFSEREWLDAADYLCGVNCASAEEARAVILRLA